jgi:NitT/TauT family transport system ATP-binding protein
MRDRGAILKNDLPKPRSASAQLTPRYLELKSQIWDSVQEEVLPQIALMERIQR